MKSISIFYPQKVGHIAKEIYGNFSEHIGGVFYGGLWVGKNSPIPNIDGWRKEAIEKLKAIHLPVLRWPGGCFAETYNWRDGIGENRPVRQSWWTPMDHRYESNAVGTDEFLHLCELLGCDAYIACNVTSMTPQDIQDWMDYMLSPRGTTEYAKLREKNGHPEPYKVKYFGVGNENWGGGGHMTPDYYALEYRKYATLMRNFYHDGNYIAGGANADDYHWTRHLLQGLTDVKRMMGGMSFHYYTSACGDCIDFTEDQWYEMLQKAYRMDEILNRHYAVAVNRGMTEGAKLVIDEWGCWHPNNSGPSKGFNLFEQQSTMRDALVTALTLNIFNQNATKIKMANCAQICNNLHCLFLADDGTATGRTYFLTTPTYHVFDMFQGHMDAEGLGTAVEDNEDIRNRVSVSASTKDGKITVTLANCNCKKAVRINPTVYGVKVKNIATVTRLCGKMNGYNSEENPENIVPVTKTVATAELKKLTLAPCEVCTITYQI